jgi:hypothetical protein
LKTILEGTKMGKRGLTRGEFLQVGAACGLAAFTGSEVPNVQASSDAAQVLTASFSNGKEIW